MATGYDFDRLREPRPGGSLYARFLAAGTAGIPAEDFSPGELAEMVRAGVVATHYGGRRVLLAFHAARRLAGIDPNDPPDPERVRFNRPWG